MKCISCHKTTTWESSYGPADFVMCAKCFNSRVNNLMERGFSEGKAQAEVFKRIIRYKLVTKLGGANV